MIRKRLAHLTLYLSFLLLFFSVLDLSMAFLCLSSWCIICKRIFSSRSLNEKANEYTMLHTSRDREDSLAVFFRFRCHLILLSFSWARSAILMRSRGIISAFSRSSTSFPSMVVSICRMLRLAAVSPTQQRYTSSTLPLNSSRVLS